MPVIKIRKTADLLLFSSLVSSAAFFRMISFVLIQGHHQRLTQMSSGDQYRGCCAFAAVATTVHDEHKMFSCVAYRAIFVTNNGNFSLSYFFLALPMLTTFAPGADDICLACMLLGLAYSLSYSRRC